MLWERNFLLINLNFGLLIKIFNIVCEYVDIRF